MWLECSCAQMEELEAAIQHEQIQSLALVRSLESSKEENQHLQEDLEVMCARLLQAKQKKDSHKGALRSTRERLYKTKEKKDTLKEVTAGLHEALQTQRDMIQSSIWTIPIQVLGCLYGVISNCAVAAVGVFLPRP